MTNDHRKADTELEEVGLVPISSLSLVNRRIEMKTFRLNYNYWDPCVLTLSCF